MNATKGTVLLAEDDGSLAFMITDRLQDTGYKVIHCSDGQTAIETFDKNKIDVCILDIMMPFKDGYAVAKKIRQQTERTPIIFLSTKQHLEDRLKGYVTGADDYLTKPFSLEELLMKLEVFLRRTRKLQSAIHQEYRINKLLFSYTDLKIVVPGNEIAITQKEADLLKFFCEHKNCILRRNEVLIHVWGKDDFFLGRSMDVYIARLRKYLKPDPEVVLETIHGIGFRFTLPAE